MIKKKKKKKKKMLIGVVAGFSMLASTASRRNYSCEPTETRGGTTVWTEIIMKELEKHLGERIVIRNIPEHVIFHVSTSSITNCVSMKTQSL